MRESTDPQTHSVVFETENSVETADLDTPDSIGIATAGEAGLADHIRTLAPRVQVDPHELEFPCMLSPQEDENGDLYVTDSDDIVRYYIEDRDLVVTRDRVEKELVAGINQRKLEVGEMYR